MCEHIFIELSIHQITIDNTVYKTGNDIHNLTHIGLKIHFITIERLSRIVNAC